MLCVVLICRGHSGDGCWSSSILFKYERSMGHLFVLSWARVRRVALVFVTLLCCRLLKYVLTMVV